jgi:hypothetical protein
LPARLHRRHLHLLLKERVRLRLLLTHPLSVPSRGRAGGDEDYRENDEHDADQEPDDRHEKDQTQEKKENADHDSGDAGHEDAKRPPGT